MEEKSKGTTEIGKQTTYPDSLVRKLRIEVFSFKQELRKEIVRINVCCAIYAICGLLFLWLVWHIGNVVEDLRMERDEYKMLYEDGARQLRYYEAQKDAMFPQKIGREDKK